MTLPCRVCANEALCSFSLPDGSLTTYDTYPERCLPDGRVSSCLQPFPHCYDTDCRCVAPWLVVCDPHRLARCYLPQPGSPHAEDGAPPPSNAAPDRELGRRGGHMAQPPDGVESRAQPRPRAITRSHQHRGEEPEAAEDHGKALDRGATAELGGYELKRCERGRRLLACAFTFTLQNDVTTSTPRHDDEVTDHFRIALATATRSRFPLATCDSGYCHGGGKRVLCTLFVNHRAVFLPRPFQFVYYFLLLLRRFPGFLSHMTMLALAGDSPHYLRPPLACAIRGSFAILLAYYISMLWLVGFQDPINLKLR